MAKRSDTADQGSLFGEVQLRSLETKTKRRAAGDAKASTPSGSTAAASQGNRKWSMPEPTGSTVAEVRLRWNKRLTPAQVARIEGELGALPKLLSKLGYGSVLVEHCFVRRRQKG